MLEGLQCNAVVDNLEKSEIASSSADLVNDGGAVIGEVDYRDGNGFGSGM